MRLYVKFEDDIFFDVHAQKMVDSNVIRPGRGSRVIPFAEHISIRKLRPRERLSHKIGNQWVSSRKISLAYLVAFYMLKNKKTVLAGFFNRGDGRYVFIEIKTGNMTIEARYMLGVDSSPRNFMAMSGRQYDGIFGDASLSIEPDYISIPYEKLLDEVTVKITPFQASVVLSAAVVAAFLFIFHSGIFEENKIRQQAGVETKKVVIPLTGEEKRALSILITHEALIKYKLYVDTLPEDIALRSATFRILPVANVKEKEGTRQELKGVLSFQFESFYPFEGSTKSGGYFVLEKKLSFSKNKGDVQKAIQIEGLTKKNKKAFETLVDLCDVAGRDDKEWRFAIAEKDYKKVVRIFNDIYLSPVVINRITVSSDKTIGELIYYRL